MTWPLEGRKGGKGERVAKNTLVQNTSTQGFNDNKFNNNFCSNIFTKQFHLFCLIPNVYTLFGVCVIRFYIKYNTVNINMKS